MKYFILLMVCLTILFSCEKKEGKVKKAVAHKQSLKKNRLKKNTNSSVNVKTLAMKFTEYSEGDLPHLVFKEVATGDVYDFNEINEQNFRGLEILLPDDNSSFGYRENPEYLNRTFKIKLLYKSVIAADPITGEGFKAKAWVIDNIQLID
jgi:hypothetical protein